MHEKSFGRRKAPFYSLAPYPVLLPVLRRRVVLPLPLFLHSAPDSPPLYLTSPFASPSSSSSFLLRRRRIRPLYQSPCALFLALLAALTLIFFGLRPFSSSRHFSHLPFQGPPDTNILTPELLNDLYHYEILSGHYPSRRPIPATVSLPLDTYNPAIPSTGRGTPVGTPGSPRVLPPSGPNRKYLDIPDHPHVLNLTNNDAPPPSAFPPRPVPFSAIDLDLVMKYCDFATSKYVRDCLQVLRTAAQLDPHKSYRRAQLDEWRINFLEPDTANPSSLPESTEIANAVPPDVLAALGYRTPEQIPHVQQQQKHPLSGAEAPADGPTAEPEPIEKSDTPILPRPTRAPRRVGNHPHPLHPTADPLCSPDYPRIFHVFWAGPFTDKPYLALLSFLYTQNLGLQYPQGGNPDETGRTNFLNTVCRPQLWVWINPGPAASIPNPNARKDMLETLDQNPWSRPFLHPRFSEHIQFKLWNTTEQLDGIPELRNQWRNLTLFNSGGVKYDTPPSETVINEAEDDDEENEDDKKDNGKQGQNNKKLDDSNANNDSNENEENRSTSTAQKKTTSNKKKAKDALYNRIGSDSADGYDRMTVILSDMARFVLTHRYGGVYLDADVIFLRDWEELWGWKGAFAYRWSRLEKYNTAILQLHRNSALGSFIFKTAIKNGMDFHPMSVSRYTKDAKLDELLLRLPDALFDTPWLNTEFYQRDRPAYPYFRRFEDFFDTPKEDSAAPAVVGFNGFFRGAFCYHYHNFWWVSFDPGRNWPDLGPRFEVGERRARLEVLRKKMAMRNTNSALFTTSDNKVVTSTQQQQQEFAEEDIMNEREVELDEDSIVLDQDRLEDDVDDLSWATVLKRTFEAYIRGEAPNMYGEYINWN